MRCKVNKILTTPKICDIYFKAYCFTIKILTVFKVITIQAHALKWICVGSKYKKVLYLQQFVYL